jgi:hypothetical protein
VNPQLKGHNIKAAESINTSRCSVAATVCLNGYQRIAVAGRAASFADRNGVISVRVGQVILYLESRSALESLVLAVGRAQDLAEAAFGPILPEPMFAPLHDVA